MRAQAEPRMGAPLARPSLLAPSPRLLLALLLAAFVALATYYNVANPLFEAPDEIGHYLYAKYIRERAQLPVQAPNRDDIFAQQEAGQGPVYYALGALLTYWVDGLPVEQWLRPNGHASIGAPATPDNKNRFVHGPAEDFPFNRDFLAAHLLRLLSTLFGAGTVLLTFLIALELWPSRPMLALGAAAINAFIPQFLYISAAVNNDVPAAFFCSAILWLALRLLNARDDGRPLRMARFAGLGALCGVAVLTKSSALAALPLVAIVVVSLAWRRRSLLFYARAGGIALGAFAAIAGWWFLRNVALYGDALPLRAFLGRSSLDDQIPGIDEVFRDLGGLRESFWALFGWFNLPVDRAVYIALDLALLWAALGLAVFLARAFFRGLSASPGLVLATLWLVIVFVALLRYRMIVQAFQGRLLFSAISSISVLLALGFVSLAPSRLRLPIGAVSVAALLAFAAISPSRYIVPAYAMPPGPSESEIASLRPPSAPAAFSDGETDRVELLGFQSDARVVPGGSLEVVALWRGLAPMEEDYSVFVHLIDADGRIVAQKDTYPCGGNCATTLWETGNMVLDRYRLLLPEGSPSPMVARIEIGLYEARTGRRLAARTPASESRAVGLGQVKVMLPAAAIAGIPRKPSVPFEDKAMLVGYSIAESAVVTGGTVTGALYFGGLRPLEKDYTVFVQLLGPVGLVAQDDRQPRGGAYPTSAWAEGDIIPHSFSMRLTPNVPPGEYRLVAGLYDLDTGRRLRAGDSDLVDLGTIVVRN